MDPHSLAEADPERRNVADPMDPDPMHSLSLFTGTPFFISDSFPVKMPDI